MSKSLLLGSLAGSLLIGALPAWADSEALSPRATGVGESLRAAATGALATSLNPAGLALARTYVIEGSYGYRHEDHAHVQAVSICDSVTSRVAACLYYNHLSADPTEVGERSLHEAGITLAAPISDLTLGITQKYVSYHESITEPIPIDGSRKGFIFDAGMTYRLLPMLTAAVVGYNLVGADAERYSRALGGGLAFSAGQRLLVSADGRYDFKHSLGRYGGGIEYMFSAGDQTQGLPVRAGYVYDTGAGASYLTGGLGFVTPRVGIDAAMRKQVSKGDELTIQFALRLFLPN